MVEIRYTYFQRIKENVPFVYFKGEGIGKYSKEGDTIVFFIDSCDESPYGAIMGVGKIKESSVDTPDRQWNKFRRKNPVFQKEEYDRYSKYRKGIIAYVESVKCFV